ncbi:MAG: hypothetical protein U0401_31240 [Anaerolineae bacterium]
MLTPADGQSSRMIRTARLLQQEVRTALVDLTQIGLVPIDQCI